MYEIHGNLQSKWSPGGSRIALSPQIYRQNALREAPESRFHRKFMLKMHPGRLQKGVHTHQTHTHTQTIRPSPYIQSLTHSSFMKQVCIVSKHLNLIIAVTRIRIQSTHPRTHLRGWVGGLVAWEQTYNFWVQKPVFKNPAQRNAPTHPCPYTQHPT